MLQVFWPNMPDLAAVFKLLEPVGEVILLGDRSLRLSPFEVQYPTMYFNRGGSIDIVIAGTDLFYQDNCLMALEQWLGERFTTTPPTSAHRLTCFGDSVELEL